jgi:hypothetical protein
MAFEGFAEKDAKFFRLLAKNQNRDTVRSNAYPRASTPITHGASI